MGERISYYLHQLLIVRTQEGIAVYDHACLHLAENRFMIQSEMQSLKIKSEAAYEHTFLLIHSLCVFV